MDTIGRYAIFSDPEVINQFDQIGEKLETTNAWIQDNNAIEKEVMELTDTSIDESDGFLRDISAKLADPEQALSVSKLERLTIAGADVNTNSNFSIKVLFLQVKDNVDKAQDLLGYLEKSMKNVERDMEALAGTPFAQGPVNALKANQRIQELSQRFISNHQKILKTHSDITATISRINASQQEQAQSSFDLFSNFVLRLLMVILVATVLIVALSLLLSRSIIQPLNHATKMLEEIAKGEGDLTRTLVESGRDEIAELGKYFNMFVDKLRDMIGTIKENGILLGTSSLQMSTSTKDLSQATDHQTEQSQTVAAAMEELTATMEENRQAVERAAIQVEEMEGLTDETSGVMTDTATVVNQVATKTEDLAKIIEHLGQSAAGISEIVNVITGISDQTSMLALNAAIEAARAGEAGRGFAVVADEVRNLAERTSLSTGEITEIIQEINNAMAGANTAMDAAQQEVEKGNELAGQGQQMLKRLSVTVSAVGEMTMAINTSIGQQSVAVNEVNEHVQNIAQSIQCSQDTIQLVAQSSGDVSLRADSLNQLVEQFRTE